MESINPGFVVLAGVALIILGVLAGLKMYGKWKYGDLSKGMPEQQPAGSDTEQN